MYMGVSQKRERKGERERAIMMLLYVCQDCGGWHIFLNVAEMLKLSGQVGLVVCVNGCGLMTQICQEDKLNIRPVLVKVENVQ